MLGQEGSIYFTKKERAFIRKWLPHAHRVMMASNEVVELYDSVIDKLNFADEEAHD